MNIYIASLFALSASAFFALSMRSPWRATIAAATEGFLGQFIYMLLQKNHGDYFAVLIATFTVSLITEFVARFIKTPSTVISYAALTPLVPGIMLYRAMLRFSENNYSAGTEQLFRVFAYAGCMAVAVTVSTIIAKRFITPLFAYMRLRKDLK